MYEEAQHPSMSGGVQQTPGCGEGGHEDHEAHTVCGPAPTGTACVCLGQRTSGPALVAETHTVASKEQRVNS